MDTLIAFAFALLVTFFFVWRYWRNSMSQSGQTPATIVCTRCGSETDSRAALCAHCRTPLSVWSGTSTFGAQSAPDQPRPRVNASLCIGCGACIEVCPEKGTLALVSGKAILANPDRCKVHGDCVTACPTSAIALLAGDAKQTMRVPETNADFESNIPGVFIIGELGGLGLIKTAINEGSRVAETIRKRLRQPADLPEHCFDVIVVGAGPAGLSAALSFHSYGINYCALEQGEIAATIRNYPRRKFLMEEPVEVPLFGKLVIEDSTKEALLEVWDQIVAQTGVRIATNQKAESITHWDQGEAFAVRTPGGIWLARYVVLATGKRGSPRKLEVPGEELSKVAYRLIEAESYDDCDVAVAGGGDSAIEAALALSRVGSNRVTLIHRGPEFARLRDRNRTRLFEAEQNSEITVLRNTRIAEIREESLLLESQQGVTQIKNDYVFVLIGGQSPEAFLEQIGVQMVERVVDA